MSITLVDRLDGSFANILRGNKTGVADVKGNDIGLLALVAPPSFFARSEFPTRSAAWATLATAHLFQIKDMKSLSWLLH